jgi:hypothetical protein
MRGVCGLSRDCVPGVWVLAVQEDCVCICNMCTCGMHHCPRPSVKVPFTGEAGMSSP